MDHETTHAARAEMFDQEGKNILPVKYIDDLMTVTNAPEFLKQFKNITATAGYDLSEVDEEGRTSDEKNGPVKLKDFQEMSDLMEICTESIAGMMNEPDEIAFENYSIPTSKMSAISFFRQTRDMLIMAIGNDDFIFDMLSRNTSKGIENLNKTMQTYKDNASIVEYLRISGEFALLQGRDEHNRQVQFVKDRIEKYSKLLDEYKDNGNTSNENYQNILEEYQKCQDAQKNGTEIQYVKDRMNEYQVKMETYAYEMFLNRMETCKDVDAEKQIRYFYSRLETKEAKQSIKDFAQKINLNLDISNKENQKSDENQLTSLPSRKTNASKWSCCYKRECKRKCYN